MKTTIASDVNLNLNVKKTLLRGTNYCAVNPSYQSLDAESFESGDKVQCVNPENILSEFFSSPSCVRECFWGRWPCAGIFFLCICTCRIYFFKIPPPPTPRSDPNSTRAVTDHHELPWAVHVRESKWRVCARESKWRLVQRKELSIVLFTDLPRVLHTQYSACCTQTLVPTLSSHGKLIVFVPRKYKRIGAPGLGASLPRALISKESA